MGMEGIKIIGVGRTVYGRDSRSIPEMVYEAVTKAMADAEVTRDDIDYVVSSSLDIFDGKIASNVMIAEVTGTVLKGEVRIADDGIAALFHATALIASGLKKTVLVVAHCKNSETDPDAISEWFVDPVFMQPLGVSDLYVAALQADMWINYGGGTSLEASSLAAARRGISVGEVESSPYLCRPIRELWRAPLCDGACAVVLSRSGEKRGEGISIVGAGLCVEPHYLGDRDLLNCPALKKAAARAFVHAQLTPNDVEIAEISAQFAHQEIIWRKALGLPESCKVNLSGGWFGGTTAASIGNPYVVAGLERVIQAYEALQLGGAYTALAHGAWGPAGQGHGVVILRSVNG